MNATTLDAYFTQTEPTTQKIETITEENKTLSKAACFALGYGDMQMKDIAKLIRKDLKTKYGNTIKFSVTSKSYPREINVTIKKIHKKHIMNRKEFNEHIHVKRRYDHYDKQELLKDYDNKKFSLKHVYESVYFEIYDIMNKYNYDNSDPMTDYFDNNYYKFLDMETGTEVFE